MTVWIVFSGGNPIIGVYDNEEAAEACATNVRKGGGLAFVDERMVQSEAQTV